MNIKKIISIILFLVSVIMIGFGFYSLNSSKNIFEKILSKSLDYAVCSIYSDSFSVEGITSSDKIKITSNTNAKMLNQDFFSLTGDLYVNNNKLYIDIDSSMYQKEFIAMQSLIDEDKVYLKIEETIDKFYYIELDETISEDEEEFDIASIVDLEKKDLKILTNQLGKSILQDLKDSDFEKNSESLIINNKSYKTNNLSIKLSEKELTQIIINFLENISNDKKSIRVLQKIYKTLTKEDITNTLKSIKESSKEATDKDILEISFYISGISDVIRAEFNTLNSTVDSVASNNVSIIIDNYKNNSNNKLINIILRENNINLLSCTITEISGNNSNVVINYSDGIDKITINGTYNKTASNMDIYFDCNLNNEKVGDLTYKISTITKNEEYKIEIHVNNVSNVVSFSSVNNMYLNETIPSIGINDATNYENMSEEEQEKFNNYISSKLEEFGFISNFGYDNNIEV